MEVKYSDKLFLITTVMCTYISIYVFLSKTKSVYADLTFNRQLQ